MPSPDQPAGRRLYRARAQKYAAKVRPAHQAIAMIALSPIPVPVSRPRSVSMIEVNGSFWANQRTGPEIAAVGQNALLTNGTIAGISARLFAPAGGLASSPNATVSHVSARVSSANIPAAAIHSTRPAVGRKPRSSATPMTTEALISVRIKLPATWPVSTEEREIA